MPKLPIITLQCSNQPLNSISREREILRVMDNIFTFILCLTFKCRIFLPLYRQFKVWGGVVIMTCNIDKCLQNLCIRTPINMCQDLFMTSLLWTFVLIFRSLILTSALMFAHWEDWFCIILRISEFLCKVFALRLQNFSN